VIDLDQYGVSYSVSNVSFFTWRLNSRLQALAFRYPRFWSCWFDVGVVAGVLLMLTSLLVLTWNLWTLIVQCWTAWMVLPEAEQLSSGAAAAVVTVAPVLTPIVPGANVPLSHLIHYFLALLIAGVLHEFGHAIAAIK
jgi:S2P endopeptidase